MKTPIRGIVSALSLIACLATSSIAMPAQAGVAQSQWPKIILQSHTMTSAYSPSNSVCLGRIMDYVGKGYVVGYIPTDTSADPAALDLYSHTLRGVDLCYSSTFNLWKGMNAPAGNFANQYGNRKVWTVDISDTNQFFVTGYAFDIESSDSSHTLVYRGNLGTNTATLLPQVFSSTFRGEVWDATGKVITTYANGESVLAYKVNRAYTALRVGWSCSSVSMVGMSLNYFKNQMLPVPMTLSCTVSSATSSATASINSLPYINPPVYTQNGASTQLAMIVEGQRELGLTYSLISSNAITQPLNRPAWNVVVTGQSEGLFVDTNTHQAAMFYMVAEDNGLGTWTMPSQTPGNQPAAVVSNIVKAKAATIEAASLPFAFEGSNGQE